MALYKNIVCHTPGLTHVTPQLHLWQGRPMFPATDFEPSATRDSTLSGLPIGLGILHSVPACANLFLRRVNQNSVCEIFLPPHEEWRMLLFENGHV